MNWRVRLRISAGVWLFPVFLLVPWLSLNVLPDTSRPVVIASSALGNVLLLSGLAGVSGAWEGARLRRGGQLGLRRRRSPLQILMPPALASILPACASAMIYLWAVSAMRDKEALTLSLLGLLPLAGWGLIGLAAGMWLPPALALSLGLVLPTLWTIMPPAFNTPWPRFATGYLADCCTTQQALAPRAVHTFALVGGALLLSGLVACAAGWARDDTRRWTGLSAALAIMVCALLGARTMLTPLGFFPVIPRTDPVTCESSANSKICVMTEHRERLPHTVAEATPVIAGWVKQGVNVPKVFTEAPVDPATGVATYQMPRSGSHTAAAGALAGSMATAPCQESSHSEVPIEVLRRQENTVATLVLVAARSGGWEKDLDRPSLGLSPEAWRHADRQLKLPAAARAKQINADIAALNTCR